MEAENKLNIAYVETEKISGYKINCNLSIEIGRLKKEGVAGRNEMKEAIRHFIVTKFCNDILESLEKVEKEIDERDHDHAKH